LEGSVRKSGDRLRVKVQVIDAADGYHMWSERYDREMKDIFDVQDHGRETVRFGMPIKREKAWRMSRNYLSPNYTTKIEHILKAR